MFTRRIALVLTLVLTLALSNVVLASELSNYIEWDGQGSDSLHCDKLGEGPERTADGWIHWIVTQAGDVTDAELVLGGSGSGTYEIHSRGGQGTPLHFFTPYFGVEELEATLYYEGMLGEGSQFVISDYCPGVDYEELTVEKTAKTSYVRTHDWSIEKEVETEEGHELDGFPKIWLYIDGTGDEKATWTVDVTYEGHEDSDFNVSGKITIENTGTLDAVITDIDDYLAGTLIDVNCGVTFPYTLEVGETLTCTYDEDGRVEGKNEVTVTTEKDTYDAEANIVWGDPTTEVNKTVTVKDVSDPFGEVVLGEVTAPNGDTFTYQKDFAWADYGKDDCGAHVYGNTAKVFGDEGMLLDSATATLKVNVQCYVYETAYAKGDDAVCFIDEGFNNWGWTNPIMRGTYEMPLWAAAGQCDTDKGTLVGSVTVVYDDDGYVNVTYNVGAPYIVDETHVYAGYDMFPQVQRGKKTVDTIAPGQYYNASPFDGSQVYVIAHAVVGLPDPDFGP